MIPASRPPFRRNSIRGVALLMVMGVLVLLSLLVVSFFLAVRQDRAASAFYATGAGARQFAGTASGIVIAQIGEATKDPALSWISQPGLLRTFNATGPEAAYKLYSSDILKESGSYNPETKIVQEIPANWFDLPDEFVDLNRPVTVEDKSVPPPTATPSPTPTQLIYPVVDPAAKTLVEGFALDAATPKDAATTGAEYNELPMPVRWIYILKDGSLASYATAKTAAAAARIAFWADDETCKVNINTASDGVFHDSPVADTVEDHDLARNQPIAQEYQRYPGHPSTTSLAAVIPGLRKTGAATSDTDPALRLAEPAKRSQMASLLTPRIGWGGSKGETVNAWWNRALGDVDTDRLYTSVDELSFGRRSDGTWLGKSPTRQPINAILSGLSLPTLDLAGGPAFQDYLKRLPFFLTTESQAPELNLFNKPRVTLWPFNSELLAPGTGLTPEDRLIQFASEAGSNKRKLYFQRSDPWDSLFDYQSIAENRDLYAYLQGMTDQTPPAGSTTRATGSFKNKFGAQGRDQIVTEMFDYVRSLVNTSNVGYQPVAGPTYSFPQNHFSDKDQMAGFNDVTPLVIDAGNGATKGLGNGLVLNEFILQFYNAGEDFERDSLGKPIMTGAPGVPDYLIRKVQLVVLMDFRLMVNNLNSGLPRVQIKITGVNPFSMTTNTASNGTTVFPSRKQGDSVWTTGSAISLGFPGNDVDVVCNNDANSDYPNTSLNGGSLGLAYPMRYPKNFKLKASTIIPGQGVPKILQRASGIEYYPFVSDVLEFRIPNSAKPANDPPVLPADYPKAVVEPYVSFNGSSLTLKIYAALKNSAINNTTLGIADLHDTTGDDYLQKIDLNIAGCEIPLPRLGPSDKYQGDYSDTRSPNNKNGVNEFSTPPIGYTATETLGHHYPSFRALSNYATRFNYLCRDMLMNVPMKARNVRFPQPGEVFSTASTDLMDVFRSYQLAASTGPQGDLRLAAARRDIPASWYEKNAMYDDSSKFLATTFLNTAQIDSELITIRSGLQNTKLGQLRPKLSALLPNAAYAGGGASARSASRALNGAARIGSSIGDYTNGYGMLGDGALLKGPDVGAIVVNVKDGSPDPYYSDTIARFGTSDNGAADADASGNAYFTNFTGLLYSPWKQMPSAVQFGTLPSRALETPESPWETLLFNPVPCGGKTTHRGWTMLPRDHFWLDLFYMPVVEPYAITENFATNGKINLNQQIAPFTYIRRNTGLHALLKNQQIMAIKDPDVALYKTANDTKFKSPGVLFTKTTQYRFPIDVAATVSQIEDRLKLTNEPFVSASEICEIPMLPSGQTAATIDAYWSDKRLTGDDKREMPYNSIYPRVTTRSNTYKVHVWAQTLGGKPGKWQVTGQYRGSETIERYLDLGSSAYGSLNSSDPAALKFPALSGTNYHFRTVNQQQFSP